MINCNSVKIRIFSIICWYPWHLKFKPFFFHLQCHLLTNFVGWCGGVIWSCEIPYGKSKEDLMATPELLKYLKGWRQSNVSGLFVVPFMLGSCDGKKEKCCDELHVDKWHFLFQFSCWLIVLGFTYGWTLLIYYELEKKHIISNNNLFIMVMLHCHF